MDYKQILMDVAIVLGTPILILLGNYFFFSGDSVDLFTDSGGLLVAEGDAGINTELGGKARTALSELRSIKIEEDFFSDPLFLSLRDFPSTIPSSPLGRPNPFVPTVEILRSVLLSEVIAGGAGTAPAPKVKQDEKPTSGKIKSP